VRLVAKDDHGRETVPLTGDRVAYAIFAKSCQLALD
jgi:hypothetical protein